MHGLYSFAVIAEGKEFLLAASSEEEKYKWVEVRNKKTNFSAIVITDGIKGNERDLRSSRILHYHL